MANKKFWLGILVMVLVFGLIMTGCKDLIQDNGAYTFEFRVDYWVGGSTISKIEFLNGSNESATVLATETVNITSGQMSNTYKVSGFTEKNGDDYRIFGVRITHDRGTYFGYSSATDESKIQVSVSSPFWTMSFYDGNW